MKLERPIVIFDLETTGTNVAKDRIVQIAIEKRMVDGTVERKKALINPNMPIPKEASEVHGVTDDMIKDKPIFSNVAKSLYEYIKDCDLSGFNILKFDLPLLVEEFLRAGVETSFEKVNYIDVFVLYSILYPRDLGTVYKFYTKKELDGAHDAMVDTTGTGEIMDAMFSNEEALKDLDAKQIHELCNRNGDMVDFAGKFTRNEAGIICFGFGKHIGQPVANELGFLGWMMDKDFTQDTLNWARKIQKGEVI
jgi:DNA polymerase-3 subunit epsilon